MLLPVGDASAGATPDIAAEVALESEPTLSVAELVEPALLNGPRYRVQPYARIEGLQAQFVIETDWGPLDAPSVALLERRINEMPMVEALHSETMLAALREAGVGSVRDPLSGLGDLARNPIKAGKRVPGGILRMLSQRARKIGDQARRIGDRIDRAVFNDGSPSGSDHASTRKEETPWWDAPVDEIGRLLRSEAGHDRARRQIAAELGITSWTGNPLLRARLDELAWALASGRMASSRIITLASAGAASALSAASMAKQLTAEDTPENQRRILEERLSRWTADEDLRYRLAWRSGFAPQALDDLITRVERLEPSGGVEALLDTALLARSEAEAQFVLDSLAMLLHTSDAPTTGGELLPVGRLVGYRAQDGEFLLPLAVDRLSWTREVGSWFDHVEVSQHDRRSVLVAGQISELAERELTRRGWSIRSHTRWPEAPPYRRPGVAA